MNSATEPTREECIEWLKKVLDPRFVGHRQYAAILNLLRPAERDGGLREALERARDDLYHLEFNIVREDGEAMTQEGAGNFAQKSYERVCAALASPAQALPELTNCDGEDSYE